MRKFASDKIEVYFGPPRLGAPDDLEQVIIEFIENANHVLYIAVQELDSEAIAQAIIDAHRKGITIKIFLEQDYLKQKVTPEIVQKGTETFEEAKRRTEWHHSKDRTNLKKNRDILVALLRNGIDVKFHDLWIFRISRKIRVDQIKLLTHIRGSYVHINFHVELKQRKTDIFHAG